MAHKVSALTVMATNSEPKTEVPIVDCFVEYQSNHIPKIYYDLYNGIGRVKCQCGVMPELQVIHKCNIASRCPCLGIAECDDNIHLITPIKDW